MFGKLTDKQGTNYSRVSWRDCCQHEEEIEILKAKLIEVHNKLIDQLDICKEQQLLIIDLTKRLEKPENNSFETFNYQSFGHQSRQLQENLPFNISKASVQDSEYSHRAKTDLLQADLEAMRNKVLAEITEKNLLKEQLKETKSKNAKQRANELKKYLQLNDLCKKLERENEHLKVALQFRKDQGSNRENNRLVEAGTQLAPRQRGSKCLNQQFEANCCNGDQQKYVIQKNNKQSMRWKEREVCHFRQTINKGSDSVFYGQRDQNFNRQMVAQKIIDSCQKRDKLNDIQNLMSKDQNKIKKRTDCRKREYEQTRELIKMLEQKQSGIRKRGNQLVC